MPARPQLDYPQADPPSAPFLFSADVLAEITDEEKRLGKYTAGRCPPELKSTIVTLLKEGRSDREVVSLLSGARPIHHETVANIRRDPEIALEIDQALQLSLRIKPTARRGLIQILERVADHPDLVPWSAMPMMSKTLYDIVALEEGRPTERTEHTERVDLFARFQGMMTSLVMDAQKMGLAGGEKAPLNGQVLETAAVVELEARTARTDPESEHSTPGPQAIHSDATTNATDSGPIQTPGDPPGGGSAAPGEPTPRTDMPTRNFWSSDSKEHAS